MAQLFFKNLTDLQWSTHLLALYIYKPTKRRLPSSYNKNSGKIWKDYDMNFIAIIFLHGVVLPYYLLRKIKASSVDCKSD